MEDTTVEQRLHLWADELRAIANEGMYWDAQNPYTVARCNRILRITAEMAALQDQRPVEDIERSYRNDRSHLAPYPVGDAAVFDHQSRILLIQRKDNGLWAMPGGAIEVGETPAEGVCREAWEETGLEVEAVRLGGIYDSRFWHARSPHQLYQLVFLCRPKYRDQAPSISNETLAVGWYGEDEVATLPLDLNHVDRISHAFRRWRGDIQEALFDPIALIGQDTTR